MADTDLLCWRCQAPLDTRLLPFGQRAECPHCHAPLHVCRMCRHHAPGRTRHCLEPMADEVRDSERANHCDWFQPGPPRATGKPADRGALAALFGETPPDPEDAQRSARAELNRLFGGQASD